MSISDNWVFDAKHAKKNAEKVVQRYYERYEGYKQVVVKRDKGILTLKWVKK